MPRLTEFSKIYFKFFLFSSAKIQNKGLIFKDWWQSRDRNFQKKDRTFMKVSNKIKSHNAYKMHFSENKLCAVCKYFSWAVASRNSTLNVQFDRILKYFSHLSKTGNATRFHSLFIRASANFKCLELCYGHAKTLFYVNEIVCQEN